MWEAFRGYSDQTNTSIHEVNQMTEEEIKTMTEAIQAEMELRLTNVNSQLEAISGTVAGIDANVKTELERIKEELETSLAAIGKKGDGTPNGPIDGRNGDPKCNYANLGDMFTDVAEHAKTNVMPKRLGEYLQMQEEFLAKQRAAGTGFEADDSELGGYTLPEDFKNQIWERVHEISNVISKVFVIPLKGKAVKIPAMGGYDRSGGTLYGGIQFYDEGENDQLQDLQAKFEQISFDLGMQGAMTHASDSLLRFSPITMNAFIQKIFADALAWRIEYLLFNGSGAGQPDGVIGHGCTIDQTAETGQAAATVVFENIANMDASLWSENGAEWFFNRKVKPQLRSMSMAVGAGGNVLNWKEELDYPYQTNEHCQALGTSGDIVLATWNQYGVATPQGANTSPIFDTSIHFKFDYAQTSFRFMFYMDGHPMWRTYETDRMGGTYAPFVTLATRS